MRIPATGLARQLGISYIEVLIAALLIVITLIPMMDAMRGAATSTGIHEDAAVLNVQLVARMEEVLGEPFSALEAAVAAGASSSNPSAYSDQVGTANRRLVFVSYYDGDNADADDDPFTGVEPDLMWVRTEIEGRLIAVETLVYQ